MNINVHEFYRTLIYAKEQITCNKKYGKDDYYSTWKTFLKMGAGFHQTH